MRLRATLATIPFLFLSCSTAQQSTAPSAPIHLVLAATTDLHGWIEGHEEQVKDQTGEEVQSGGLPLLGGYLNILRKKNPQRVALFDSGDLFQGTLASNLAEGEPITLAYNALRYDAVAIGNHEFDYGPRGERSVAGGGDDPVGAFRHNAGLARFPFLAANIREKATGRSPSWARPYTLLQRGGATIGVVGVITPDTPVVTTPGNVDHLVFDDPAQAIQKYAAELRLRGADTIVVLAHIGGMCADVTRMDENPTCEQESDLFRLARALPARSVDVIFGGHTHSRVRATINGIALAQAYPLGRGLAVVDLFVDRDRKTILPERTIIRPLITLCERVFEGTDSCLAARATANAFMVPREFEGEIVRPDSSIQPVLEPYLRRVAEKKQEQLHIRVAEPFTRDYLNESALGNLITDAMRRSDPSADFAVINSGGLRADLSVGNVTYGDVFEVLPFDNFLAILRLSGAELRELIHLGTLGRQGILQVSGLRIVLDRDRDRTGTARSREHIVDITTDKGESIDPERIYTVITTDFVASGGDGLMPLTKKLRPDQKRVLQEKQLRDLVIQQLQRLARKAPLRPRTEGRITYRAS